MPGEGDEMFARFLPTGSPHARLPADRLVFAPNLLDPPLPRLIVRLEAELPPRHEPGTLSDVAFVDPLAEQGHLVLKEGEFDLEFPFPTRRALGEELQQDPQAVVALDAEVPFELVVHRGAELAVEDDGGDSARVDPGLDLLERSAADGRAAVRMVATLGDWLGDPMGRGRQDGRDLSHVGREGNQEDVQQLSEGGRTVMNVSSGN